MANYTYAQLEQLWINAGGSKELAPLAAAIAEVESGGNPAANNADGGASGIWQLIPSNWQYIPGGGANRYDAASNAIGAVRLSGNTLGGLISNWIDSEPAGAAYAVLKQHGGTPPSGALPAATATTPASTGSTSTSSTTTPAPSSSNIWTDIANPFSQAWSDLTTPFTGAATIVESVAGLGKDFNTLVKLFTKFMQDIEWLFVPSHWVRIFAFMFGIGALIPGVWALIQVGNGKQGDITLAIGILLITLAGVLLFVAFHNLPTTVTDLQGLLGYISQGIKTGQAPASGVAAGQLAPVPSGQLPAGG
jgi:hypothetical protein